MSETNQTERGLTMLRKLFIGLLASTTMLLVMSSLASAQEAPNDESVVEPTNTVDCTLLNFTPPESWTVNGNHAVGAPITLELYTTKGGAMYYWFVATQDGGEPYRLNDGMDNTIEWTPTTAGTYVIHGEFESTKTGETVAVEDPEKCSATFFVEDAPLMPVPEDPEPGSCADPATPLTPVPQDDGSTSYYSPDGELCGTVIGNQQTPAAPPAPAAPSTPSTPVNAAAAPELPRTGSGTGILAIVGIMLVLSGTALLRKQKQLTA